MVKKMSEIIPNRRSRIAIFATELSFPEMLMKKVSNQRYTRKYATQSPCQVLVPNCCTRTDVGELWKHRMHQAVAANEKTHSSAKIEDLSEEVLVP